MKLNKIIYKSHRLKTQKRKINYADVNIINSIVFQSGIMTVVKYPQ